MRAAAGEHEHNLGVLEEIVVEDAAGVLALQQVRSLGMAFRHQNPALFKGATPLFQRPGHIGQGLLRVGAQMRGQPGRLTVKCRLRFGRDHNRLERPQAFVRGRALGRLFKHGMGIGAAHAKAVDASAARMVRRGPVGQPVIHPEGRCFEINGGVRRLVAQRGRHLAVMQRQCDLDQAGDAGCCIQMPDVGLYAADTAGAHGLGALGKTLGQRGNLDRIAQIGARPVAFDIVYRVGGDTGDGLRLGHAAGLTLNRRRKIPCLGRTIIVHGRSLEDRPDMVAVTDGIDSAAQHDTARTRTKDRALRTMVKGMAMPIWRQDLTLVEHIAARVRQFDRHTPGKRHVAFAVEQGLRGVMHRDERGGARRLDVDRGTLQVKDVAHARGQKVLVVAGVTQKEHARAVDQIAVRAQVEVEIRPHAAAGIDADRALESLGHMACILHRLPRHLKEMAVLRIKDGGLFRREAKEVGVEMLELFQN